MLELQRIQTFLLGGSLPAASGFSRTTAAFASILGLLLALHAYLAVSTEQRELDGTTAALAVKVDSLSPPSRAAGPISNRETTDSERYKFIHELIGGAEVVETRAEDDGTIAVRISGSYSDLKALLARLDRLGTGTRLVSLRLGVAGQGEQDVAGELRFETRP